MCSIWLGLILLFMLFIVILIVLLFVGIVYIFFLLIRLILDNKGILFFLGSEMFILFNR